MSTFYNIPTMKNEVNKQLLNAMHKNPDNWKWIFYINRRDPQLIVPKLNPTMGWTINFGNTWAVAGLIVIIAIIVSWSIWM